MPVFMLEMGSLCSETSIWLIWNTLGKSKFSAKNDKNDKGYPLPLKSNVLKWFKFSSQIRNIQVFMLEIGSLCSGKLTEEYLK